MKSFLALYVISLTFAREFTTREQLKRFNFLINANIFTKVACMCFCVCI